MGGCSLVVVCVSVLQEVSTDDPRGYLADYHKEHSSGKVTIDNMRRIFSSFLGWLEDEDYILKSLPTMHYAMGEAEKFVLGIHCDRKGYYEI